MTPAELRTTIVARHRLGRELQACDAQLAAAMRRKDRRAWEHYAARRETAWTAIAELDSQAKLLARGDSISPCPKCGEVQGDGDRVSYGMCGRCHFNRKARR